MVAVEIVSYCQILCFADRIGWGYKRKRNVKGDSRGFDLSNWVNIVSLTETGNHGRGIGFGGGGGVGGGGWSKEEG